MQLLTEKMKQSTDPFTVKTLASVLVGTRGFAAQDPVKREMLRVFVEKWKSTDEDQHQVSLMKLEDALSCVIGCKSLDASDSVSQYLLDIVSQLTHAFDAQTVSVQDVHNALWKLQQLNVSREESPVVLEVFLKHVQTIAPSMELLQDKQLKAILTLMTRFDPQQETTRQFVELAAQFINQSNNLTVDDSMLLHMVHSMPFLDPCANSTKAYVKSLVPVIRRSYDMISHNLDTSVLLNGLIALDKFDPSTQELVHVCLPLFERSTCELPPDGMAWVSDVVQHRPSL
jgi:hypothetical protein